MLLSLLLMLENGWYKWIKNENLLLINILIVLIFLVINIILFVLILVCMFEERL